MKGIDIYKTKEGFCVAQVHYTADEDKSTPEWLKEAEKGFVGGRSGAAWRKEMEIDFTAYSGQLLCYDILQRHRNKIIIELPISSEEIKYGSLDWGRSNPASFHIYAVGKGKHIHSTYEIYLNDISIPDFSKLIKLTPYFQDLRSIFADPSIWNKNQETKEGLRSLEDMFQDNGIYLTKGKSRDDEIAINELLDRWYMLDINEARFTISPRCAKQIWEFERLRYKKLSTAAIENQNQSETLVDKDNHSWDDFKYFISSWLSEPQSKDDSPTPRGTVAAFIQEAEIERNDWRAKYK